MRLSSEQKVKATIRPVTAAGNPARIDGVVTFTSSDESVFKIEPLNDTTCYAVAVGPGTARITASFDADLDADETRLLEFDAEITVIEAEAEGASVEFAEPEFLILTPVGEEEVVEEKSAETPPAAEEGEPRSDV